MKQLFSALLLIWLSACSTQRTVILSPAPYHSVGNTWAYKRPGQAPVYRIEAGIVLSVIGYTGDWWLTRTPLGERLYVPIASLVIDSDSVTGIYYNVYYYPHRGLSKYQPGEGPAYSLRTGHETYLGPRGGEYYINGNGNKTYITPQSTIDRENVQTGPRGGQYYINGNGRKIYIKH